MRKNITIINSVAVNGGDEALLKSTIFGLKEKFVDPNIIVLSSHPILCKGLFPEIKFDWDWEYAFKKKDVNENEFIYKIKKKIRSFLKYRYGIAYDTKFSFLFGSSRERRVLKTLISSDFIICSPGGYLHDFYGYSKRVNSYNFFINSLNKDVHVFGQSVGPFFLNSDRTDLSEFFEQASSVVLREHYSEKYIREITSKCEIKVSVDIAFYLRNKFVFNPNKRATKKIVICFREWLNSEYDIENKRKARILINHLISKYNCRLTFISTCQGVKDYRDDSKFAYEIMEGLSDVNKTYCTVISGKMNLEGLIQKLSTYDAYIGMRLHGAILSMIAGLPALNIGYEDKTAGIYKEMGLEDYCFRFEEPIEKWINTVNLFFLNQEKIKKVLPMTLDKMADKAKDSFNVFNSYL